MAPPRNSCSTVDLVNSSLNTSLLSRTGSKSAIIVSTSASFFIHPNARQYRGLKEWERERGYLRDTCLAAQDKFKKYLDYFRIPYDN